VSNLADIPTDRLQRLVADPANAIVKGPLERELARRLAVAVVDIAPQAVAPTPAQARAAAHRRGEPNRTELAYRRDRLDPLLASGEVVRVEFEAVTWYVHGVARYTPDWLCWLPDGSLVPRGQAGASPRTLGDSLPGARDGSTVDPVDAREARRGLRVEGAARQAAGRRGAAGGVNRAFWLSTPRATGLATADAAGRVLREGTCPYWWKAFGGKPLNDAIRTLRKQPGFTWCELA